MNKTTSWILHEMKLVWLASAFFAVAFGVIVLLKYLILAQYEIEGVRASSALLGALLVGKVVVILNKTSLGNRFRARAVALDVFYRSLVYTFFCLLVVFGENLVHGWIETGSIGAGFSHVLHAFNGNHFAATGVCVFLSFIVYNLFSELARHIGWKETLNFLFRSQDDDKAASPS